MVWLISTFPSNGIAVNTLSPYGFELSEIVKILLKFDKNLMPNTPCGANFDT